MPCARLITVTSSLCWILPVPDSQYHWKDKLAQEGWCTFSRNLPRPRLAAIATALDIKRMRVDRISATTQKMARSNTLSSRYGMDAFPLHSDCALLTDPPHYLVLTATRPRAFGTTIWDSWQLPATVASQAVFLINQPKDRRYARFQVGSRPTGYVRYNAAFFQPMNEAARTIERIISENVHLTTIDWRQSSVAIIDNWRMLHGREPNLLLEHASMWRATGWGDK